jgi:hypothetical protein
VIVVNNSAGRRTKTQGAYENQNWFRVWMFTGGSGLVRGEGRFYPLSFTLYPSHFILASDF